MDRNFDFQIEKLSKTIEELKLDRRAYHILKRADVHYVSDIIARGEASISNLKNMGPLTINHVFSRVANYLNVPREKIFNLDLPFSTIPSLKTLDLFSIKDLLKLKAEANDGYGIGNLEDNEVRKIYRILSVYLTEISQIDGQRIDQAEPLTELPIINLSEILRLLFRNERAFRIVELRAFHLLTLEEIAAEVGGVTRERIRQILDQVHNRIYENLNSLIIFCDFFEERTKYFREKLENDHLVISLLVDQLKHQLPNSGLAATDEELKTLIAVLRLLVIHGKPWIHEILQARWMVFTFLACLVDPPIKKHQKIDQIAKLDKEKNRKMGYKELAYSVLSDAKEPLHWLEIVDRAYRFGRRDSFNSTALYNALMSHPGDFVRVDAGTYALLEWGYSQAEYYPNIIASILKSEKKPLSLEAIYSRVGQIRNIRRSTLTMLLTMHPRFYKSRENTYGLRVWLPPREKQTLRTPEWLVEDGDSIKRIEQSSQRGYDVESIIAVDIDKQ